MEFRDLIINDNVTSYHVVDKDLEFFQSLFDEKIDQSIFVSDQWFEVLLQKNEQKLDCDFSFLDDFDCILISSRAQKLLSGILNQSHIEYLPCKTEEGIMYIINFTTLLEDTIMEEESEFQRSIGGIITRVTNLIFYCEAVENKTIFKIKELPYVFLYLMNLKFFAKSTI